MRIETERLIMRNFVKEDINDVYSYMSNKQTMYFIENPYTIEQVKEFLEECGYCETPFVYALIEKQTQKVIGHIIFHEYSRKEIYELGFIIDEAYQSKGYGYEISKKVIQFGFEVLKLHKIIAETIAGNEKSMALIKKLGFTQEALLRKQNFDHGKWVDEYYYGILKEEYILHL